ncbi:hypothetical protein [Novosphingobium percolationis]|uniref:hypothetical protein n=1 Tax=Novosphingobium percolationis TaxID=2871811 RepID=UPI001CD3E1A9|nr:hypothetical protein [Novosphingobium percolationis]
MIRLMRLSAALPLLALSNMASAETRPGETLAAETNRPESSTFAAGEPITLTFHAEGLPAGESRRLAVRIKDDAGREVAQVSPVLTADAQGRADYAFAAPRARLGYYEVSATLDDGTTIPEQGTRPAGIISYAVVPDPATRVDYGPALSRFGMQGGFNRKVNVMPLLGVRYYITGTHWVTFEAKAPGEFPAARAAAQAKGKAWPLRFEDLVAPHWGDKPWRVYPLGQVVSSALPDWARVPGTEGTVCRQFGALNAAGAKRLPGFAADYARSFMADHPGLNPRIYQMTWEPADGWCYNGTAEQLVQIYRLTYDVIHKIDPNAVIAGPTLYPAPTFTTQISGLWKAGLGKYLDAFSLHASGWGTPPETHGIPDEMRKQIAEGERISGRRFKIISTEHGTHSAVLGLRGKAAVDTRVSLILLGEGAMMDTAFYVADFFDVKQGPKSPSLHTQGFYWNLRDGEAFGSTKLGPKISVPVYAAMTKLIDGSVSKGRLKGLAGTQYGYRFVRGATTIDAVWDYGAQSDWPVPAGATVCDWMGNCGATRGASVRLTDAPVYIIVTGGS